MALRFVIGRAGSGKSEYCLQEIREQLKENQNGKSIIYLVPNQMTFQAEHDLLNHSRLGGMISAQVYSFTRLAWKVLQETGGISRYHVDEVGVNMLLRRIVDKRKNELKVFKKAADQNGFYDHVSKMMTEFKNYQVTPEILYAMKEQMEREGVDKSILSGKLFDLQMIFDDFEKALLGTYVDSTDYLRLLAEKIPVSSYLKEAHIYVDGFYELSPQQMAVLGELMKHCEDVTVILTGDMECEQDGLNELHLFNKTATMYQKIYKMALETGCEVTENISIDGANGRFATNESLAYMEKEFDTRPVRGYLGEGKVQLLSAVNRRAEVEGIAREIKKLVQNEGYRYRDISILLRNSNDYHDLMKTILPDYEIPFFIDEKRSMHYHPFIECIRSSLEVIKEGWRSVALFRCMKTDLFFPVGVAKERYRDDMDFLENYCLAYGIQGKRWTSDERWTYRKYRSLEHGTKGQTDEEKAQEEKMDDLRQLLVGPIGMLQGRLKRAKNVRSMCEAVYLFLEELEIPAKLDLLREQSEERHALMEAKDHEMVWKAFIDLLDQYVEMLGEEEVSLADFINIMETGLESLQFANFPPSIDQVTVSNVDHSRLSHVKCGFLIGVNEGVIPKIPDEEGMISEQEREILAQYGVELAPTGKQQLLDEQFAIYLMVTTASHKLYISYPLADEEGKSLLPSSFIKRMKQFFPRMEDTFLTNDVNDVTLEKQLAFVSNPSATLSYLAQKLQNWKKYGFEDPVDFWWDVYNFYIGSDEWKFISEKVLSSLSYQNKTKQLPGELSSDLYGKEIRGSVSRMESFNRCAYQHFANHGLKLRKRETFKLEAPDVGQLFHLALKNMTEELTTEHKTWSDLSSTELEKLSYNSVGKLAPAIQREILLSSNRYQYITRKLQQVVHRASIALKEHSMRSGFVPIAVEENFGKDSRLPSLHFDLDNGAKMELVGQIDRVDRATSSLGTLLRIVDYKSSDKSLNVGEVYYGLALQMLTYLDIIITHSKEWIGEEATPAGVLYFHVHNPILQAKSLMDTEDIEQALLKEFKMKGLLLGEADAVREMDTTLIKGRSDIVSVAMKENGEFYANAPVASMEEFTLLKNHVRNTFQQIGNKITNGVIDIEPYKLGNNVPCTFCDFKSVCQFDPSLEENDYRTLKSLDRKTAIEKMREELGCNGKMES